MRYSGLVTLEGPEGESSPTGLKAGTTVKRIRLVDGGHTIDCRVDGIGQMGLKSELIKMA